MNFEFNEDNVPSAGLLTQSGVEGILRTQLSDRDSEVMFMLLNIGSIREDVFAKISNQHVEVKTIANFVLLATS